MHIRVLAVGDRQPEWVNAAFDDYRARLPRDWQFSLKAIASGTKSRKQDASTTRRVEGQAIVAAITGNEWVVALDERGTAVSSAGLAGWLGDWQSAGRDVCLVIGGADGLSEEVRARADGVWSLSPLTLPHGMVRVLLIEQLYRAWSLSVGHPYHRS